MKLFTPEEDQYLRDHYLTIPCKRMAKNIGRAEGSIAGRMKRLGIVVPPEIVAVFKAQSQFQKGSVPQNKGQKMSPEVYNKIKKHFFQKGSVPHNIKTNGYIRMDKDGYQLIRKEKNKFVYLHRLIWEKAHGKIPKGNIIIFRDGDRSNFQIENLECITRNENSVRNRFAPNYPREIQEVEYLRIQLKRKIKQHGKKQNTRSKRPSVCST